MTHPHITSQLELKFLNDTGFFEGYASVFHVTDSVNDRVAPGAFAKSLAKWQAEGRLPPLLWQHDADEPIGVWRQMFEDSHGLFVKGELFVHDITRARETSKLLRENVVTGLSIGYRAVTSHRDAATGARVLTEVELLEVSVVTFPANDMARVRRVKSMLDGGKIPSEREFEAFLRDAGMSRKQAKGVIAHGYKALGTRDAAPADTENAETAALIESLAAQIRLYT